MTSQVISSEASTSESTGSPPKTLLRRTETPDAQKFTADDATFPVHTTGLNDDLLHSG